MLIWCVVVTFSFSCLKFDSICVFFFSPRLILLDLISRANFLRYEIPDQNDNEYEKRETLMEFRSHTCFLKNNLTYFCLRPSSRQKKKMEHEKNEEKNWAHPMTLLWAWSWKKKLISRRVIDKNIESKKILLWYYGRERVFISVGKTCPFLVMCCHFPNTRQVLVFPSETELSF